MKELLSTHKIPTCLSALLLIILISSCFSSNKHVPNSIVSQEMGIIAEKADKVTFHHSYDSESKVDSVTVTLTYDNKYCKSVCKNTYQYLYHKSDDLWSLSSKSGWSYDDHLKDFATKEGFTRIEKFTTKKGKNDTTNSDHIVYYCLDIDSESINSETNTLRCRYDVEVSRDQYIEYAFSSDDVETVTAKIFSGGAVAIDLKDPSSNLVQRIWLNGDDFIDPNFFF